MERSIEATTIISASADRVRGLLASDPSAALSNPTTLTAGGLHHDVIVTLDEPEVGDALSVPVSWHPVDHARLFPSFLGALEAEPSVAGTRLRLAGSYSVPLGVVGQFGDGLIGRRLAQQSLQSLLEGVATRITAALDVEPPNAPIAVVEQPPEVYIG